MDRHRQGLWTAGIVFGTLVLIKFSLTLGTNPKPPVPHEAMPTASATVSSDWERPPPRGPLPEICKPWMEPPPSHRVRPSELDVELDGESPDGLDCWSNGMCDYKVYENAYEYALEYLFAKDKNGTRAPHGGGVDCEKPLTADWVTCHVNVTNVTFDVVEVVDLTCPGTWMCKKGDCCRVTSRRKTFIPSIPPSKKDIERVNEEMRQNREKRYQICRKYCFHSKFKDQCSKYWRLR